MKKEEFKITKWNGQEEKLNVILRATLKDFCKEFEINENLADSFEAFANYLVRDQYTADPADLDDLYGQGAENGIDGVFFFIEDREVRTADELEAIFESARTKKKVTVVFVQSKTETAWNKAGINVYESGVRDWIKEDPSYTWSAWHEERQQILHSLWEYVSKIEGGKPEAHLYYCAAVETSISDDINAALKSTADAAGDSLYFRHAISYSWDHDKLVDKWSQLTDPVRVQADLIDSATFDEMPGVGLSSVAIIRVKDYINQVLSDEDGNLRRGIFDENVRDYLGSEIEVNLEIANSIKDAGDGTRFGLLNNGITIISPSAQILGRKLHMDGFQVVNGCQTSNVLYDNREFVNDSATIVMKVVQTEDNAVSDSIVRSTNRQSQVDPTQFMAMSNLSKKIEKYFVARGEDSPMPLYYERRTNQYAEDHSAVSSRTFNLKDLSRNVASMFFGLPHVAKRYPNHLFSAPGSKQELGDEYKSPAELILDEKNRIEIFYTAAYAYWRLWSILSNTEDLRKYKSFIYHIMYGVRNYLIDKPGRPDSSRMKGECEVVDRFFENLSANGNEMDTLRRVCGCLGDPMDISRDVMKTPKFTSEFLDRIKEGRKIS